ncbi:unnamed protein product [Rotaria sp. Silwood2]|nr:unnamed protein product [Rotaria sp. Silwood2]CAF4685531.1 unnamed protein product [Rotaria sp. Silwood2]
MPECTLATTWSQEGKTVAGGKGEGNALDQLYCPTGLFIDSNNVLFVSDAGNGRIIKWEQGASDGTIVAGFQPEQLKLSTSVIVDREGTLFITDGSSGEDCRVIRWRREATSGETLFSSNSYLTGIAFDVSQEHFYVSHCDQQCVIKYAKDGSSKEVIVADGNGQGSALNQLDAPIDEIGTVYVSDLQNRRLVKWFINSKEAIIVAGGNGEGSQLDQLSCPMGILIDHFGAVYTVDAVTYPGFFSMLNLDF